MGEMASTPLYGKAEEKTVSINDVAIWKRLGDAGFDEETMKNRDKAALIAYVAKLETEVFIFLGFLKLFFVHSGAMFIFVFLLFVFLKRRFTTISITWVSLY